MLTLIQQGQGQGQGPGPRAGGRRQGRRWGHSKQVVTLPRVTHVGTARVSAIVRGRGCGSGGGNKGKGNTGQGRAAVGELVLLCYATAAMTQRRTLRSRPHGLWPQARLSVAKSHQVFLPGLVYEPRVHTGGYKDISLLHRCMPNVPRERGADS